MPESTTPTAGKSIAVMQPYFFPYAGYFRLFAAVDEFVLYDCVQFPRRGRVHRTQVPGPGQATEWLTLPLVNQDRDVLIRDLKFAENARNRLDERLERLTWLKHGRGASADSILRYLQRPLSDVTTFLEQGLHIVARELGLERPIIRSSTLDIDPALRGEARVLAIAAAVAATRYINPPGGIKLYDQATFCQAGIELQFLPAYSGPYFQLLPALMAGATAAIRDDVRASVAPLLQGNRP